MSPSAIRCPNLTDPELELLQNIAHGMPITADLSRSDLLLVCPRGPHEVEVVAQAQPNSISSLYNRSLLGQTLTNDEAPVILDAWRRRGHVRAQRDLLPTGAPVVQEVYPIPGVAGQPVAFLSVETSLIQLERHHQRHASFQRAIEWLKGMCMRGELAASEGLSPFGEWDGVLLVDAQRRITYLSGIANNLYRRLGYMEDLRGKRLSFLNTSDDEMVVAALENHTPLEREVKEGTHIWIRKVLPLWTPPTVSGWLHGLVFRRKRLGEVAGALIAVHDATEERLKKQELEVKTTMIQEVHHRVKNNLQAIAATLRMQARRTKDGEALHVLREATARILSVAVIHEFLSLDETQTINMRDVCQRVINQNRDVVMTPGQEISFVLEGPAVYLPSQHATAFALVVNELIHNAIEHGFEGKLHGQLRVALDDRGEKVHLEVWDDGEQLPPDFDLVSTPSLGLQIVRSLAENDLRGQLWLKNQADGVLATVEFPKVVAV
ncbi:MAG: histidine kinase N-terminal domain-containing protein [Chloroflexi bacterium]|nr:histidine kinase N-terminal domain-containing protein [Chloroflexota bacterium]